MRAGRESMVPRRWGGGCECKTKYPVPPWGLEPVRLAFTGKQ